MIRKCFLRQLHLRDTLQGGVEASVGFIALVVCICQGRIALDGQGLFHRSIGGLVDRGVLPAGGHGQEGAAERGALLGLGEVDVRAQNIRQNGLPDLADGTAAAENGFVDLDTAGFHAVAESIGYALKDGQAHVLASGIHGQTDERAAGVDVVMRAALTRQVGQEVSAPFWDASSLQVAHYSWSYEIQASDCKSDAFSYKVVISYIKNRHPSDEGCRILLLVYTLDVTFLGLLST